MSPMLGHELRNPIGIVRNSAALLCRTEHTKPELGAACGILDRQLRLMSRLVNDLLNLSRIASGQLQLQREPLDLGALLLDILQSLRHQFDGKDQKLTYTPAVGVIRVFGDRDRLVQVFANLLHNAHKFTQLGGHIEVALRRDARNALVSVRDDGAGIPPDMLEEVFQLFQQVGQESGRGSQTGLGIGLALARNFAQMHGGDIRAQSAGTGRGCEFIVELPLLTEEEQIAVARGHAPVAHRCRSQSPQRLAAVCNVPRRAAPNCKVPCVAVTRFPEPSVRSTCPAPLLRAIQADARQFPQSRIRSARVPTK